MSITDEVISEDSFIDDYCPITLGKDGDQIAQSYGDAQLAVRERQLTDQHIWAIVEDGDSGSLFASPGFHVVNTIGFVVTEKPWQSEFVNAIWYDAEEDLGEDDGLAPGPC